MKLHSKDGLITKVDGKAFVSQFKNDDLKRVLMVFPEDAAVVKELE